MAKVSVDANGFVNVLYTNSMTQKVAQVALAKFASPTGLASAGGTLYSATPTSGAAVIDPSNLSSNTISSNSLEQSNVDMADQLVQMILTQQGLHGKLQNHHLRRSDDAGYAEYHKVVPSQIQGRSRSVASPLNPVLSKS